jgi:hypothetical protein
MSLTTHPVELAIAVCAYFFIYHRVWFLSSQISKIENDISFLIKDIKTKKEENIALDLNNRLNDLQQMNFAPRFKSSNTLNKKLR